MHVSAKRTEDGTDETPTVDPRRRRIDVTDVTAGRVQEYVRENVGTERVSLEHRGARTSLLVEK